MATDPTLPTVALPRRVDSDAETLPADGRALSDETLPGSIHARLTRSLVRGAEVGRYLVLEELGRGGMGVVYAAYDPDLDRRIAIKVLRGRTDEGTAGSARLLREAQALAKLADPNVIGVFDVGSIGDEVFVAMELVSGGTLREHTKNQSWSAVIDAYIAAGRGLAAAHAAGLVHRDFKPENVLVGPDRRPRVTDFGLVRATASPEPAPKREPPAAASPAKAAAAVSDSSVLELGLTAEGTVMGTPSYMAPEQMIGESATAASDQYAFAVALWEALFGARPYPGKDIPALRDAILAGKRAPYDRRDVPVAVVRALDRALAAKPTDRWPTMDALLAELETASRPRRRRWLAAAIAATGLVALGVGGAAALGSDGDDCAHAGDPAAALWSRDQVAAAFASAAPGFGADSVGMIESWVAMWRDSWQRRARAACEATRVEHTQSDEVLDLKMTCLDRKLEAAHAIVAGLVHADRSTVERAGDAMVDLPELADCDDVAVLRGRQAKPSEPNARDAIAKLERELDDLDGARSTTFAPDGRAALRTAIAAAVPRAEATGYQPVIAEVRLVDGELALDLADGKAARAALLSAAAAAIRGGDPPTLADAYLDLIWVATDLAVDFGAAHAWLDLAAATIDALHDPGHRRIALEQARAHLAQAEGDLAGARAALDRALATPDLPEEYKLGLATTHAVVDTAAGSYSDAEATLLALLPAATAKLGTNHPRRAGLIHDLGNLAYYRGEYAHAAELHGQALDAKQAAFGADAPELIITLQALGIDEDLQGHRARARELLERAVTIARAAYGDGHVEVASVLRDLAGTYHREHDHQKELDINREVLAIQTRVLGTDHPETAMTMVDLGIAAKNLGLATGKHALIAEAIASEEGARAVFVAKLEPDHLQVAETDDNLGWAYLAAGRDADAIAAFTRAEAGLAAAVGADHPVLGDPLTGHGLSELGQGHAPAAVELLERAAAIRAAPDIDPGDLAETNFALARALRAAGKDRGRATELAEQALAVWKARGASEAAHAAEAARFLGQ